MAPPTKWAARSLGVLAVLVFILCTVSQPTRKQELRFQRRKTKKKARREQAEECAGWLDGTRDTYRDPVYGNVVSGGFTSQSRQDSLLWQHVFSKLGRKGVYLDVAANHYKRVSNTFFYDACAKWRGICVEPNPVYHDDLRKYRTCDLVPTCASDTASEVEIALPSNEIHGLLGGVNGGLTRSKVHATRKQWNITIKTESERNVVKLRCAVLKEELAKRSITHVDLLSLDVEGHEASVLDGFDLEAVRIDYVLCEATKVCAAKLGSFGYTQIRLPEWPLKGDTVWRHPALSDKAPIPLPPPPSAPIAPAASLSDCRGYPCIGFGTAGAKQEAIEEALRAGYTLIDTAVLYRREKEISSAIRKVGVPRDKLTIISKAWPFNRTIKGGSVDSLDGLCDPSEMVTRVEEHIKSLGVGHLDVLLLHWPPAPQRLPSFWRALVDVKRRGLTKAIGLSNAGVSHLELLSTDASTSSLEQPTVVQTELSAVRSDLRISDHLDELVAYSRRQAPSKRVHLMSHSSVKGLLKDNRALKLAARLNVSIPQLGLRFGLQKGFTMLFGSRKRKHIVENLGAMRFHLTAYEMEEVSCWRKYNNGKCKALPQRRISEDHLHHAAWKPMVGSSVAELLAQHPDPFEALSRGLIPAIVLKEQLGERERQSTLQRLLHNPATAKLWSSANEDQKESKYGCLGRQINNHMKSSKGGEREYTQLSQETIKELRAHGLWAPVDALYESLRAIAGDKRSVGPAVDASTNLSYSPAAYRYSMNGGYFSPHVDSMHSLGLKERGCPDPVSKGVDSQVITSASGYTDAYRFQTQFSALVLLQAGGHHRNKTSSSLTIHRIHLDDLQQDCLMQVAPTSWNTAVTLCPTCKPSERNTRRLGEWPRVDLAVEEGSVYVFNSNYVHEVHAVHGDSKRVTLGSFVGYSEDAMRVWI